MHDIVSEFKALTRQAMRAGAQTDDAVMQWLYALNPAFEHNTRVQDIMPDVCALVRRENQLQNPSKSPANKLTQDYMPDVCDLVPCEQHPSKSPVIMSAAVKDNIVSAFKALTRQAMQAGAQTDDAVMEWLYAWNPAFKHDKLTQDIMPDVCGLVRCELHLQNPTKSSVNKRMQDIMPDVCGPVRCEQHLQNPSKSPVIMSAAVKDNIVSAFKALTRQAMQAGAQTDDDDDDDDDDVMEWLYALNLSVAIQ